MQARLLTSTIAGLFLILSAGCRPVVWLSDSSGFVWTEFGKEESVLIHYDMATGKARIVAKDAPAMAPWPALSPDGKQVALARLWADQKKVETLQFIVYSLQGKEIQRTPEVPWAKGRADGDKLLPAAAFWGPGDTLLVHDFGDTPEKSGKGGNKTGIYDLNKKTCLVLDGSPMTVAGTPISPNRKGFLLWRQAGKSLDFFFIGWDGAEHKITMGPRTLDDREMLQTPWRGQSEWRGPVAVVKASGGDVLIDTEKKSATFAAGAPPHDDGSILQRYAFHDNAAELRVVAVKEVSGQRRLELLKRGDKKPVVVAEGKRPGGHAPGDDFFLSPSPNRQWVAVRIFYDEAQQGRILLINDRGEVKHVNARSK